jgi:2'-5' RNA ligase
VEPPASRGSALLAVVIPLEGEAGNRAAGLQSELFRRFRALSAPDAWPHVSIKLGFTGPDPARVADWLGEVSRVTQPFEIGLGGIDAFDEGILFIDVLKVAELEALRERVLRDLEAGFGVCGHPIEGEAFRFHVTLAHGLRGRDFAAAKAAYLKQRFHLPFMARHLELLLHAGTHWMTLARLPLGSEISSIR